MDRNLTPALGADIGGTAVKLGRLDAGGGPYRETRIATCPEAGVSRLIDALIAAWEGFLGPGESLESLPLGIGCAGLSDAGRGRVVTSPNLPGWSDTPLVDLIRERAGRAPLLMNDANAFVLAEGRVGAGADLAAAAVVVGLSLGTGVGGGILLGQRLLLGSHGFAGEPGHMVLAVDGPPCACGNRGCVEALIGTRGIQERYRVLKGSSESPSPAVIAARAAAGEAAALATWRETGRLLGIALASLTQLLDPDLFVIGGGVSAAGELLLAPARAALAGASLLPPAALPRVVAARLGNSAGWIGAAIAAGEDNS